MAHPSGSRRKKVKKTCAKCGKTSLALPRERRCKQQNFGPGSYWCWGALTQTRRKKKAFDPDAAVRGEAYRSRYEKKQVAAHARAGRIKIRIKRLQTALKKWQQREARYARQAGLSDAEVHAVRERARKAAQVQSVRRRLARSAGLSQFLLELATQRVWVLAKRKAGSDGSGYCGSEQWLHRQRGGEDSDSSSHGLTA